MSLHVKRLCTTVVAVVLLLSGVWQVGASSVGFTVTMQKQYDKLISSADSKGQTALKKQVTDLSQLQNQSLSLEEKTKSLRFSNEEALLVVRNQIKLIDAKKLDNLQRSVKQTRDQYQTLLDLYSALNQQYDASKSMKSLRATIKTQIDAMKPAVQLAKQHIRNKEATYKAAKAEASKKASEIRTILKEIDSIKVRIKAEKSSITTLNKKAKTQWDNLKLALKSTELQKATSSLTQHVSYIRQIVEKKSKWYAHESNITNVISKARAKL